MSTLILIHVVTGLMGIAAGLIAVVGMICRKRMASWNVVFLLMTLASCATGIVFLPSGGVTSAQLVAFFVVFLLGIAAYSRYVWGLEGSWNQVYAFTVVGALFLNILITTTQSFVHIPALKELAPTEQSPVYVAVKFALVVLFIGVALIAARRAGRS